MLISVLDKQDVTYQFCEAAVEAYLNESIDVDTFDSLILNEMSEEDEMKLMWSFENKGHSSNLKKFENDPSFLTFAKQAQELHPKNPFAAAKAIDLAGDIPSRAQGIGINQPQAKHIKALTFWSHPVTMKATGALTIGALGAGAAKAIYDYRNKPTNVISKKIASLRQIIYRLRKKMKVDSRNAPFYKKAIAKLGDMIDKLLGFMEKKSNKLFR